MSERQITYDLCFLKAVLNWATMAAGEDGKPFLYRNPLKGFPLPRQKEVSRPIMPDERYRAVLRVAEQVDWRFRVALELAHETGHRSNAVRLLLWKDVDLERGWIRWAGGSDKTGYEHETPLTEDAQRALRFARTKAPVLGCAWVLPAPKNQQKPVSRYLLDAWWRRAERLAGLEPVRGLGWHGLRRKFATGLKEVPLKDLCQLGGWKDPQTILKCYQKATRRPCARPSRVGGASS